MDDFAVKYCTQEDAMHLLDSLNKNFTYSVDWQGQHFCELKLAWEYTKEFLDMSITNYIKGVLLRFNHQQPNFPQHSHHEHTPIKYGK